LTSPALKASNMELPERESFGKVKGMTDEEAIERYGGNFFFEQKKLEEVIRSCPDVFETSKEMAILHLEPLFFQGLVNVMKTGMKMGEISSRHPDFIKIARWLNDLDRLPIVSSKGEN